MAQPDEADHLPAYEAGYIAGLNRRARIFKRLAVAFCVLAALWVADTAWLVVRVT